MSQQLLDERELAAVLEAIRDSAGKGETPPSPIDLSGGDHLLRRALPMLDAVLGRFVERATRTFTRLLRTSCELTLTPTDIVTGESARETVDGPVGRCVLGVEPGGHAALLAVEPQLVRALVELEFGGGRAAQNASPLGWGGGDPLQLEPPAPLTPIERRLCARLVTALMSDLTEAFTETAPLAFKLCSVEPRPELAHVIEPPAPVLRAALRIVSARAAGQLTLFVPAEAFEALRSKLSKSPTNRPEAAEWARRMNDAFDEATVEMVVELGRTTVPLSRIVSLEVGEVIRLERGVDEPLPVCIEGEEKLRGVPAVVKGGVVLNVSEWSA